MTLVVVVGVLLVAVLAAMALHDRRARARGARVRGDIGAGVARREAHGNPDAHRVPPVQGNPGGGGFSF